MASLSTAYTATTGLEFLPPPPPGFLRAVLLALVAHLVLGVALTFGVSWRHSAEPVTFDAELWAQVPQQAAPPPVEVLPPMPVVKPELVARKEEPPPAVEPHIVTEREKKRLAEEKLREKQAQDAAKLVQKKAEALKQKEQQERQLDRQQEMQRQENIKRMAGLANASQAGNGPTTSAGTTAQSSGPSASYGGRIRARVKPNIVFTEDIAGNPQAIVEVRTAPDGTIVGRKLVKTSGVPAWDEAVLKAIDKTEVLPKDIDGRVPPSLEIAFRPKD